MKIWMGPLALAMLFAAPTLAAGQTAQPAFSIHIYTVQNVVRAGSPVDVEIVLTITTTIPFTQSRGHRAELEYSVDVRDIKGDPAPESMNLKVAKDKGTDGLTRVQLDRESMVLAVLPEPGTTFWEDLDLSNLFDLSRPGKYTVQVSRFDPKSKANVKSNTITVTVEEAAYFDQRFVHAAAPFLLAITTPDDTVKSGSDVPIRMYATNVSSHEITYDCAKFNTEVLDALDNLVPWIASTELLKIHEAGSGHACTVGPYRTRASLPTHLNKLYDIAKPGKYTIQVSRVDEETKAVVKSNIITVTVVP